MKRILIFCVFTVLVLAVGSRTQAGITYVDVVDSSSGQADTRFVPPGGDPSGDDYYRWHMDDWGWAHTFNAPEAPDITINWATLAINAFDVDFGEVDLIEADGLSLGQLEQVGADSWHLTTLTLDSLALDELLDGTLNIWMNIDATQPGPQGPYWAVALASSTLTVDYDVVLPPEPEPEPEPEPQPDPPDPPDPPTQTIPAPGAVLLGGIGIGLVGWLRRRRTL